MNTSISINESQDKSSSSMLVRAIKVALGSLLVLLIPFTASFLSEEMDWSPFDYILVWIMLFLTGTAYSFITRNSKDAVYRIAVGLAVVSGLMLTWVNLAVGLIGSEDNPINLSYFFILALGILASFMMRFKAVYMTMILVSMAFGMVIVAVVALFLNMQSLPQSSVTQIMGVTGFFMMPLLVAAILFYQAHIDHQKGLSE
jgi:hypothetical protein